MLRQRRISSFFFATCHVLSWLRSQRGTSLSHWKFLGDGIIIFRSRIKTSLRESIGLFDERRTPPVWAGTFAVGGEQVVRKLEALVNSYSDAYRMQIHRIGGGSGTAVNIAQAGRKICGSCGVGVSGIFDSNSSLPKKGA